MKTKLMILAIAVLISGATVLNTFAFSEKKSIYFAGDMVHATESTGKITGHEKIDKNFCYLVMDYLNAEKKSGVTISKNEIVEGYTTIEFKKSKEWRGWDRRGSKFRRHRASAKTDEFVAAFEKCVGATQYLVEKLKEELK